ncbi:hypothetical protein BH10ACT11_BH10ACT11_16310 [soil metagenome]
MSGRYRIIALQAVGVAVLAAIVYLAFLRPSEPNPLSGITGPDARQQANNANPGGNKGHHPGRPKSHHQGGKHNGGKPGKRQVTRPGSRGRSAGEKSGASGSGSSQTGSSTPSPLQPGTGGGVDEPSDPDTPPGSQYQDTVSRITAKLNE